MICVVQVKAECPSLVYAHITAYGLSGPEAQNVRSLFVCFINIMIITITLLIV